MDKELTIVLKKLLVKLDAIQAAGTSTSYKILLAVVPIVGIVVGGIVIFYFLLWRYRLNAELIKLGNYENTFWKHIRIFSLLVGSISASIGLPMTILFLLVDGVSYSVLGGVIPLFSGIGFLVFFYVVSRSRYNEKSID
jgi:hypothetical protein